MDKIVTESGKLGLSLNVKKTCCLVVSKKIPKCQLVVDGQVIKQVKQFSNLGRILASGGRCDTEIKTRIGVAKKAFMI